MGPSPRDMKKTALTPTIPDYLIYDEIKRRREKDAWQPDHLEMPLYRPEIPRDSYVEESDTSKKSEESEPPKKDRGVFIIDMNDLLDEDE